MAVVTCITTIITARAASWCSVLMPLEQCRRRVPTAAGAQLRRSDDSQHVKFIEVPWVVMKCVQCIKRRLQCLELPMNLQRWLHMFISLSHTRLTGCVQRQNFFEQACTTGATLNASQSKTDAYSEHGHPRQQTTTTARPFLSA